MKRIFLFLILVFLISARSSSQTIDSLKLSDKEIPEGYTSTTQNNFCLCWHQPITNAVVASPDQRPKGKIYFHLQFV
jgi:hypothetical protein